MANMTLSYLHEKDRSINKQIVCLLKILCLIVISFLKSFSYMVIPLIIQQHDQTKLLDG